jgi:hypothetical protein
MAMADPSDSELSSPGDFADCRERGAARWLPTGREYPLWPELDLPAHTETGMRHRFREPYYPNAPELVNVLSKKGFRSVTVSELQSLVAVSQ